MHDKIDPQLSQENTVKFVNKEEKLRSKLYEESQNYYESNMNIFQNGMSLLATNAIETHGFMSQIDGQKTKLNQIINTANAHTLYTKSLCKNYIKDLK